MDKRAGEEPAGCQLEPSDSAPVAPRHSAVLRIVERLVLPRLAERLPGPVRRDRFGSGLSEHVPVLARLALSAEDRAAKALLHRLHRGGLSFSQLQLGLIAPTARAFESYWQKDRASFVEVTEASGLLKRLMHFVALDLSPRHQQRFRYKTVLVAPAPGETHNIGALMAAEYFRRDGWDVQHLPAAQPAEIAHRAARQWLDVAAFSITVEDRARLLAETVTRLRKASLNRRLLVVVGGEAIVRRPSLAAAIGADAIGAPLPAAPNRTLRLVRAQYGADG